MKDKRKYFVSLEIENPGSYRWNEATPAEVLARLLDLNQKRYEQEILGGTST